MNDRRKNHTDPEGPAQENDLKQLQTNNVPTCDGENTNGTNKGIFFLLTSHGLFPEERKGCHKGSRGIGELLYTDQHILNESKTRR